MHKSAAKEDKSRHSRHPSDANREQLWPDLVDEAFAAEEKRLEVRGHRRVAEPQLHHFRHAFRECSRGRHIEVSSGTRRFQPPEGETAARSFGQWTPIRVAIRIDPCRKRGSVRWPSSQALARWGWAVAVVVVALQTATHLVNALVLDRQRRWLDAAVDASIFGRMNTVAIALCALFAAVGAALGARTARRLLLSLALLVLAVDDATGVHDRIRDLPRTFELGAAAAFALLLGLVLVLLVLEARQAPPVARWLLGAGLVALGLAVVVRVVGAAANSARGSETRRRRSALRRNRGSTSAAGSSSRPAWRQALRERSSLAQPSSPPPHCPAFTAMLAEKVDLASMTAPTFPEGAANSSRSSRYATT